MVACSACGAQLAQGVSFCSGCGRPITAFAMPVQPKKTSVLVWLAWLVLIFTSVVFIGSIANTPSKSASAASSPRPASKVLKEVPAPTSEERSDAIKAGLSNAFITAAWPASRRIQDLYMRDLGWNTEFDRSDETAKLALMSAKKTISNPSDKRAWDVLAAMLWEVHVGPVFAGMPVFKKYMDEGQVCFMGARIAFGQDVASGDWKNAISECIQHQRRLKAELDKA
jgi:hypothetical protein